MLSILICSLAERQRQLQELLSCLNEQKNDHVEILTNIDNREKTVGEKRNELMSRASRKYVAFIDDDDIVSAYYVSFILNAIKDYSKENNDATPDCIGLCGYIMDGPTRTWQFRHSITVSRWCRDKGNKIYFRTPNHLNAIKTELARQVQFPLVSWGEDRAYSDGIRPLLKTEKFIEAPIYFYKKGNK